MNRVIVVNIMEGFNKALTPPFEIADNINTNEEKRLEYRYLDLRRPKLQKNILNRSKLNQVTRRYFSDNGFVEVETPFMVKYTPGGARNFLVPSRMHHGSFYALAESPQLFKQLLMVAGYDRYFQIVRCFRDEDLRLDRQPEFTQLDVEMSFINQDDLFTFMEGFIFKAWQEILGIDLKERYKDGTFPRMKFAESMTKYGNDKPDLRFGLAHTDLTQLTVEHDGGGIGMLEPLTKKFKAKEYRVDLPEEIVKALVVPADANFSRKDLDDLEKFVKSMGAGGLARAKVAAYGGVKIGTGKNEPNSSLDSDTNRVDLSAPFFNMAAEVQLLDSLYVRTGAEYTWQLRRTNGVTTQRVSDDVFHWSVGLGFQKGTFYFDGVVKSGFVTGGPHFLGGTLYLQRCR